MPAAPAPPKNQSTASPRANCDSAGMSASVKCKRDDDVEQDDDTVLVDLILGAKLQATRGTHKKTSKNEKEKEGNIVLVQAHFSVSCQVRVWIFVCSDSSSRILVPTSL